MTEEHKEKEHQEKEHEEKHEEKEHHAKNKKKMNMWKISTFVLIILLAYVIGTSGLIFSTGKATGEKAVTFINDNLLQTGMATLNTVSSESGLYKATIDIEGESAEVYLTKDGKYMFLQPIPLEATIPTDDTNTQGSRIDIQLASDDHILGDENAPITLVEYSDFQCPYCEKLFTETLPLLKENYIDTGMAKLVYRHFPLSNIHPMAQIAAEASECAADQGKFWEMHDMLFNNQQALDSDSLKQYAKDLGLNSAVFDNCLDSGEKAERVARDLASGQQYGVTGTPATFVDGLLLSGAQPFSSFQQAIDSELNN